MAKSGSSKKWLQEHVTDEYVIKAQQAGYRSRAVFKLQELNEKYRLIRPGMTIVDLGAAPGGWSQLAAEILDGNGKIIAIDLLPIDPLAGVEILQGDFREDEIYTRMLDMLNGAPVDLVLSDMAPNMSGMNEMDQPRAMYLAELAAAFARETLKDEGSFLCKVFQGEGFDSYIKELRQDYQKLVTRKPAASRNRSREVYVLGRAFGI